MKNQSKARILSILVIFSMLLGAIGLPITHAQAATTITVDGAVPTAQGFDATPSNAVTFTNAPTGTGSNRLMLVGISWNSSGNAYTINSVQYSYGAGPTVVSLTQVVTQKHSTQNRYAAIYSLVAPPSGQTGSVIVTFSGSITTGVVVGVMNFAGVDQSAPIVTSSGTSGNTSTSETSDPSLVVSGLAGDEMVFDTFFVGGTAGSISDPAPGAGQTLRWNNTIANARGKASTEEASGSSVTMNWATTTSYWVLVAAALNPAPVGPTYNLTMAVSPSGGGTTNPPVGVNAVAQGSTVNVTATPNSGYAFSNWSGACTGSGACSVLMDGNKSVTANFVSSITFTGTEMLGRPEATQISVSCVPNSAATIRYQYSTTTGGPYTNSSSVAATAGAPAVVTITGLTANTKYYYRMQYSTDGGSNWVSRSEKSFWTQRAQGSTFTFDITTDSHINIQLGNQANWTSTLNGVAADNPDFLIDLGDTVAMDNGSSSVAIGDITASEQRYKDTLPALISSAGSAAFFSTPGNHEQQEAWHLTASNVSGNPANSLPVMAKNAEKKFFLNPVNDSFYSGDSSTYSYLSGDQLKQDYYAWTWGDALFVVISPYWTTTTKPYTTSTGGGEGDTTGSGNRWDWTLGLTQFNWLQSVLSGSSAKYKFVFSHQIVGGNSASSMVDYGHGGVDSATLVEWGGNDVGGSPYTWATNRSGWGSQPIRQMMEANNVSAFFHGHDHQYAYETYNDMVYTSVPSGSFTGSFNMYTTGGNGGNTIYADSTQGAGHLKVTVGPAQTTVDFIRYNASTAAHSYTIAPNATTTYNLTVNAGTGGTITAPPTSPSTRNPGEVVTITATPNTGYHFVNWTGNVSTVANVNSASTTVTMNGDYTITANFAINTHTLTYTAGAGGTITAPATSPTTHNYGAVVTITAVPNTGYHFVNWTGNVSTVSNVNAASTTITMNANYSITANFAIDTHTLTCTAGAGGTITAPATSPTTHNYGAAVTITAVPNTGYHFVNWTGNVGTVANVNAASTTITMNGSYSITANFAVTNVAPVANPDTYTTQRNLAMTIDAPGVLGNDTDGNSDPLTAVNPSTPSHGDLTLNANGSFTYTPDTDYTGDDSFTYQANDGALTSNTATVTIHVTEVEPPVMPSSFHGNINISPAPTAGDLVEAYVPGAASAVATTPIKDTTPLTYAFDVPGDIAGTSAKEGGVADDVITFKINGNVVGTGVWHSGTSVELNFTTITKNISLLSGWNLVSFNLKPASTAIEDVLASVDGNYSLVYAWDAATGVWMKFDSAAPPFVNTLEALDETQGFWIKLDTADTLTVSGSAPDTSNIALKTGWNLVGYPSVTNLALPGVFSSHGVGDDFSLVYAYHANDSGDPWKKFGRTDPEYSNDLLQLSPDWGYWVKVGGAHTWDVSY